MTAKFFGPNSAPKIWHKKMGAIKAPKNLAKMAISRSTK